MNISISMNIKSNVEMSSSTSQQHSLKSMERGGTAYKALKIPDTYPTLSDEDRAELIDFLTRFFTVSPGLDPLRGT